MRSVVSKQTILHQQQFIVVRRMHPSLFSSQLFRIRKYKCIVKPTFILELSFSEVRFSWHRLPVEICLCVQRFLLAALLHYKTFIFNETSLEKITLSIDLAFSVTLIIFFSNTLNLLIWQ